MRILFPTSFGYFQYAYDVARRHPDVFVLWQGERREPRPGLSNFGTYWGSAFEPVYLAGIAAGAVTSSHVLGYVVAFPNPATFDNVNAFTLGAQSVNPNVTTRVVFTGSWCDPARQIRAADELIAAGADVLTQHQDCTRTVLEEADRRGVFSVGYHEDGSEVATRGWLVGSAWNWGPLMVDIVGTVLRGDFPGSAFDDDFRGAFGSRDDPLILTELSPRVPQAARDRIEAERATLSAGASPFQGPVVDRDGHVRVAAGHAATEQMLDGVDWFVNGVVGSVP